MVAASELRQGMAVRFEESLWMVVTAEVHAGGGKMGGVAHAKLRNLETGAVREQRFRPDEPVEDVELERVTMQFLYADGGMYYFMHPETFHQVAVEEDRLGPSARYLKEQMAVGVEFYEGRPMHLVMPEIVELKVVETAPPVHSQGTDNVWKEARLESGVTIQVPPFIAPGETIRVQIATGSYVERAKAEKKR